MQIEPTSLLIGLVAGLCLAALTKLKALRELRLKLDRIGIELGISGFAEQPDSPRNQTIGDVSGAENEINQAGRDINKTSNFYQMMQAAAEAARVKTQFEIRTKVEHRTSNEGLRRKLGSLNRNDRAWLGEYCSIYMNDPEFISFIFKQMKELANQGWITTRICPIDNLDNGLLVELVALKPTAFQA